MRTNDESELSGMTSGAEDRLGMAQAGLYLLRQGIAPVPSAMQAVYEALRLKGASDRGTAGAAPPVPSTAARPIGTAVGESTVAAALVMALGDAASSASGEGAQSDLSGDDAQQQRRQLAQWLLNVGDGGSVGDRYCTLPPLGGGPPVEINLALFQEHAAAPVARPLHRMVMNVQTQRFGSVRVRLEALDARLKVSVSSATAAGTAALADSEPQLRAMLAGMGWQVEALTFHTEDAQRPAAHDIVQHVLLNGSVDRAW